MSSTNDSQQYEFIKREDEFIKREDEEMSAGKLCTKIEKYKINFLVFVCFR